jgi:hypothetical protein
MTALHMTAKDFKRLTKQIPLQRMNKGVLHLLTRTENEIGMTERYRGRCGVSGITKRQFVIDASKVTCPACQLKPRERKLK